MEVTDSTLVLERCHEEIDPGTLRPGAVVTAAGRLLLADESTLRAVVVYVHSVGFAGELAEVAPSEGGRVLTFRLREGDPWQAEEDEEDEEAGPGRLRVFLPEGQPVLLEGDGEIPPDLLTDLVSCEPRQARVRLETEGGTTRVRAREIRVEPEELVGRVEEVLAEENRLTVDGRDVRVMPAASIIDLGTQELLSLASIRVDDEVRVYGLAACAPDLVDFHGFVIIVED